LALLDHEVILLLPENKASKDDSTVQLRSFNQA
jgi:hypothetical protein